MVIHLWLRKTGEVWSYWIMLYIAIQDVQGLVGGQQKLQFRPDQYEYCEHHCHPR